VNPLAIFESPDEFRLPGTSANGDIQQRPSILSAHDGYHECVVANTDTPVVGKDE
jgi:hypothetical protein